MRHRRCSKCGGMIPLERLELLPDTTTCVRCSDAKPVTDLDVEIDTADQNDVQRQVFSSKGER